MLEKLKEKFKNAFKSMKEDVVQNDDGAELLEIVIGIALVAVIVAVVIIVINKVNDKGNAAAGALDKITWEAGTDS